MVGGVTIRLQTPECTKEAPAAEISFEQQMLVALQELSGKSFSLHDALKSQFAKNAALGAAKTMSISGSIQVKPKVDAPAAPVNVTATAAKKD